MKTKKQFEKKRNDLEVWCIVAKIPQQNLAWIDAMVSEKPELTDGRKTDACTMTVALLTESSRAKNDCPRHGFELLIY